MKVARTHSFRGFTLVETAIAMAIVAVMISAFMVVFGPAVTGIKKSISAKEATRLSDALEHELSVVRAGELDTVADDNDADFVSAFEKAYYWIRDSTTKATAVLIYQYRGDPDSVRSDGTLEPYTGNGTIPGVDYVIQTAVRRLSDAALVSDDLEPGVLEGKVYYVRMTQLVYSDTGEMEVAGQNGAPGGPGQIIDPTEDGSGNRDNVTNHAEYPEAVLAFQAQFYALPNVLYDYIDATWAVANPGTLVITKNMAVTR